MPNGQAKRRGGKNLPRSQMHNPRPLERRVGRVDGATTLGTQGFCSLLPPSCAIRGKPLLRPTDLVDGETAPGTHGFDMSSFIKTFPVVWEENKIPQTIREFILYVAEKGKDGDKFAYVIYHCNLFVIELIENGYELDDNISQFRDIADIVKKKL